MVDPPANATTTPIKISQTYQFPRLACAHGHTLDKPFYDTRQNKRFFVTSGNDILLEQKLPREYQCEIMANSIKL